MVWQAGVLSNVRAAKEAHLNEIGLVNVLQVDSIFLQP